MEAQYVAENKVNTLLCMSGKLSARRQVNAPFESALGHQWQTHLPSQTTAFGAASCLPSSS
eukprot:11075101-Karenia_brevis.AAC.1